MGTARLTAPPGTVTPGERPVVPSSLVRPALLLVCSLAACAASRSPPPGSRAGAEAPPLLQLPEGVRPLRYALAPAVVPSAPGVTGTAAIEIELAEARTSVWMHARDLRVSSATVEVAGSAPLPAAFAQVSADGVAKVEFARALGPGGATLRFAWSAAWGGGLAGLFLGRAAGSRR